ncbi:hypothetical protein OG897_23975 [Streptomyces sp. NBC_00237]|uniref:hypothetical protein n=1 Tax=Streptomyces sp. NBC_00237 TaxID=2975687 RepID=UPI0022534157|nr:hypothetical protein [Streptomyces sp. NBC_00237]MCX5204501.1 hypothetical protein [Streptomyces sp. NBC_00237]
MADLAGTTTMLRPHLLDLSGVPLGKLGEVDGFSYALDSLRSQLAHTATPFCSGTKAMPCAGALAEQAGFGHES